MPALLLFALLLAPHGNEPTTDTRAAKLRAVIFQDDFESGNVDAWVIETNMAPNCNCYFSGDCKQDDFCNWGPAGPFNEDICNWRTPKPNGTPGLGCDTDVPAPGPICDGHCSPARVGSLFGHESPELLMQGLDLWARAMLIPASSPGGGPLHADDAAEALALEFDHPSGSLLLGRHVADLLSVAGGLAFYHYYCHFEFDDQDPLFYVDLSEDPCRLEASMRIVDALIAELDEPGSGAALIEGIRAVCPSWREMFKPNCAVGDEALTCVYNRVKGYVTFLRTPREVGQ